MAARHIDDDDLERYALMCLPEARVAAVEEHLLVCAGCQDRLAHWDEYLRAMRGAMRVIGEKRTGTAGAARSV